MKIALVSGACLAAIAVVGVVGRSAGTGPDIATPDGAVAAGIYALRHNKVRALVEGAMGPEGMVELEQEWNDSRKELATPEEAREFAETMKKLTASGAEDALFAELQPKLQEMKPQIQMMAGMLVGMGQAALGEHQDLSADERQQAQAVLAAAGKLLMGDGVMSEKSLAAAIAVVCSTARSLELKTADQLAALSFDAALAKGDIVLAGVKRILDIYGMDIDAFLDSVEVEMLSEDGDHAVVRVSFKFLGVNESVEADMVRENGRWRHGDS